MLACAKWKTSNRWLTCLNGIRSAITQQLSVASIHQELLWHNWGEHLHQWWKSKHLLQNMFMQLTFGQIYLGKKFLVVFRGFVVPVVPIVPIPLSPSMSKSTFVCSSTFHSHSRSYSPRNGTTAVSESFWTTHIHRDVCSVTFQVSWNPSYNICWKICSQLIDWLLI